MRTETHKLKACIVRLAVDQNEVWPDVAVAVIAPLAAERMIEIAPRNGSSFASTLTAAISSASSRLLCGPNFSRL
jgi:hypothetical protein